MSEKHKITIEKLQLKLKKKGKWTWTFFLLFLLATASALSFYDTLRESQISGKAVEQQLNTQRTENAHYFSAIMLLANRLELTEDAKKLHLNFTKKSAEYVKNGGFKMPHEDWETFSKRFAPMVLKQAQ